MVFRGIRADERLYLVNGKDLVPDARNAITDPFCDLIEKRAPVREFLTYPEKSKSLFRALCP